MYCSHCGCEVSDAAKFCGECGAKVYRGEVQQQRADPSVSSSSETPVEPPISVEPVVESDLPSGEQGQEPFTPKVPSVSKVTQPKGQVVAKPTTNADQIAASHDEILDQLEKYIGPQKWKSHYHKTFSRLLKKELGEEKHAGNGWNWSAFFFTGFWCLHRRLWFGFFAAWFAVTILNMSDLLFLQPAISVLLGVQGDQMLFDKAYRKVLSDLAKKPTASH